MKKALPREVPFIIAAVSTASNRHAAATGRCPLINRIISEGDYSIKSQSNKLTGKDLINVGIYSAIYFVIVFLIAIRAKIFARLLPEMNNRRATFKW